MSINLSFYCLTHHTSEQMPEHSTKFTQKWMCKAHLSYLLMDTHWLVRLIRKDSGIS